MRAKIGHTKMDDLWYSDLELQPYFKSNKFSVEQVRTIFRFRTRTAKFGENFQNGGGHVQCPLCHNHFDSQALSFKCPQVKAGVEMTGIYEEIFRDEIPLNLVISLEKMMQYREKYLQEMEIQ